MLLRRISFSNLITLKLNCVLRPSLWNVKNVSKNSQRFSVFFSRPLLLARSDSTSHSAMSSIWWSVCPWQDLCPTPTPKLPPPQIWFLGSSGNFKQLLFLEKKIDTHLKNFFSPKIFFFTQNFFLPKIFFHTNFFFFTSKKFFPTFTFLCISGCFMLSWVLKKIFTQNFSGWSKARHNATKHF